LIFDADDAANGEEFIHSFDAKISALPEHFDQGAARFDLIQFNSIQFNSIRLVSSHLRSSDSQSGSLKTVNWIDRLSTHKQEFSTAVDRL